MAAEILISRQDLDENIGEFLAAEILISRQDLVKNLDEKVGNLVNGLGRVMGRHRLGMVNDTKKLQNHEIHRRFIIQLKKRFQALAVEKQMIDDREEKEDQVERKSEIMEKAYVKTAKEVLGYKKKKNRPWFSQEAWTLVEQRKAIKQKLIGARSERRKKEMAR